MFFEFGECQYLEVHQEKACELNGIDLFTKKKKKKATFYLHFFYAEFIPVP